MLRDIVETPDPTGMKLVAARQRAARRALWFVLIPVMAMVVFAVVSFDGDWTYLALAGAMVLVVLGMMYLERRRTEHLLPPGYRGLLAEVLEGNGAGLPVSEEARTAMARLTRLQAEMDALAGLTPEIRDINPRLGMWAAALGAALWLIAAAAALFVHQIPGAFVCLVMSAFFGGLAWFTHEERKRREGAVALLTTRMSQAGGGAGDREWPSRERDP
jgi:hypothetical protein